ncbi:hypothetical protein CcI49_17055 [Frankia sp. CcI49]|uniref:helix-turn-helix transcriptional regulator n=1 Tax=Frankia sp. CcI49 TaxID=1745382 RepID=UPI0009779799|nr:hypothetical protein [Frankia sp. CcI49]ONH59650.1 hypothetical protein CcI49_17055 [Frankia sp. CcI49]
MTRPDEPQLWTTSDIANRIGTSRERARQLTKTDTFPRPITRGLRGAVPFWRPEDVENWITIHRPDAVRDADVEKLPELWAAADVAAHLGKQPHELLALADLPTAVYRLHHARLWKADEIRAWAADRG